jgi:hypothetical protein
VIVDIRVQTKSNIYISTMVATRSSRHAASKKAKTKATSKEKAMAQKQAKQHKKPWVPGKRSYYKCQLCSSFDITHENGEVVKVFPGSQYVFFLYLLNWYTCNLPASLSCSGNQICLHLK